MPTSRRQTTAKSLVREALLLAACAAVPVAAWAARPVSVFEVDVSGQSVPALQQAMRAALVRATGRRESAIDPAFGGLIADAPKYVQSYDRGPQGEPQVIFNAAAVDRAIAAVDRGTWDPNRPFTLVVISPAVTQADQAADRGGLQQAAEERGLPISVVPLPVADSSGNVLAREALLEMAHRYGAEQLLIGRPPTAEVAPPSSPTGTVAPPGNAAPSSGASPSTAASPSSAATSPSASAPLSPRGGQPAASAVPAAPAVAAGATTEWQWTLYTDFTTQTWTGPLTAGIDDTVDLLAPPPGATAASASAATEIEIQGVSSLADYAHIEQMLGAVPGVSKANVRQVDGDSALFDLTVRGGAAAIDRALSRSSSFSRVGQMTPGSGAPGAPLVYRYRPG